jgi:hypothetical protein
MTTASGWSSMRYPVAQERVGSLLTKNTSSEPKAAPCRTRNLCGREEPAPERRHTEPVQRLTHRDQNGTVEDVGFPNVKRVVTIPPGVEQAAQVLVSVPVECGKSYTAESVPGDQPGREITGEVLLGAASWIK